MYSQLHNYPKISKRIEEIWCFDYPALYMTEKDEALKIRVLFHVTTLFLKLNHIHTYLFVLFYD